MDWFGTKRRSGYFDNHDVTGLPGQLSRDHDPVVETCLAEFHALREEIGRLREEIAQYQAFALAITAALAPLLGYELSRQRSWIIPTLAIVPLPFTVLGFLFFRQNLEIYIEAAYIRDRIRPLLTTRCPEAASVLWTWEDYKHATFGRLIREKSLLGRLVGHRLALFMRVSLFLGPATAALVADTIEVFRKGGYGLVAGYHTPGEVLLIVALVTDLLFLIALLVILQFYGDAAHTVLDYDHETGLRLPAPELEHRAADSVPSAQPASVGARAPMVPAVPAVPMAPIVSAMVVLVSLRYLTMRDRRRATPPGS